MNEPRPAMISARPLREEIERREVLEHPHGVVGAEHRHGAREANASWCAWRRPPARRPATTPRSRDDGARPRRTRRARPGPRARSPRSDRRAAAPRSPDARRHPVYARRTCRSRFPRAALVMPRRLDAARPNCRCRRGFRSRGPRTPTPACRATAARAGRRASSGRSR